MAGTNDGTASGVGIARLDVSGPLPTYPLTFGFISGTPAGYGYTGISDPNPGLVVVAYDASVGTRTS